MSGVTNGPVKKIIDQFELEQVKISSQPDGKTSNGRSAHPVRPDFPSTGQKTHDLAQEKLPQAALSQHEIPTSNVANKVKIFEQAKSQHPAMTSKPPPPLHPAFLSKPPPPLHPAMTSKAPPLTNEEKAVRRQGGTWEKTEHSAEASQTPISGQQRNESAVPVVVRLWEKSQTPLRKFSQPQPAIKKEKPENPLANKLLLARGTIAVLNVNKNSKLVVKDGKLDIAKRRFGITWGRSDSTKAVRSTLKEMGRLAQESNDPKIQSDCMTILKELRDTPWGKKIERNNEIKSEFNEISDALHEKLNATLDDKISHANSFVEKSSDRKKLTELVKSLTALQQLPHLTAPQNESINAIITKARTTLGIDHVTFVGLLLGQDPHTEGRQLLLKSAGGIVKGEKFIKPIHDALEKINDIDKGVNTQTGASKELLSLTNAALKLATLPKIQLDAQFISGGAQEDAQFEGSTLREALVAIRDKAILEEDSEIRQNAQALNIILTHDYTESPSLGSFQTALQDKNYSQAFTETLQLAFLSQGELDRPLPLQGETGKPPPPLRTVREEIQTVLIWANQQPEYKETVGMIKLLMDTNAEKPDKTPFTTTLASNALKMQDGIVGLEGKERKKLLAALTEDFRAQFGSLTKLTGTKEFEGLAWSKKNANIDAPKIMEGTKVFNYTSAAISTSILNSSDDLSKVEKAVTFYIELMDSCIEDKNFAGAMAINAALNFSPISRLPQMKAMAEYNAQRKLEAKGIPQEKSPLSNSETITAKQLGKADELLSQQSSYKALRAATADAIKAHEKPIPFIGALLTDLTFIEDGNKSETADGKINLKKAKMLKDNLQIFTQARETLTVTTERKTDFFANQPTLDEDSAYEKSLVLSPRKAQS